MAIRVKIITPRGRFIVLRWIDPQTGIERQQSTKTLDRSVAEQMAIELSEQLTLNKPVERLLWEEFRRRFEIERMPEMTFNSRETYGATFRLFERAIGVISLRAINGSTFSQFMAALRIRGCKEITVRKHVRQIRAALQWAVDLELLERLPTIPRPVRGTITKKMKGRPLDDRELQMFLEAIPQIVPADTVSDWKFLALGLWTQGLRISEAMNLGWDIPELHRVDLSQARPVIWIVGQLEKTRRDRMHIMTKQFFELLQTVPQSERTGRVFRIPETSRSNVSHIGSAIGKKAGILVNRDPVSSREKFASFHDFRRSFACRFAKHLKPFALMELMRHSSLQVTHDFYIGHRTMETAEEVWNTDLPHVSSWFQNPKN